MFKFQSPHKTILLRNALTIQTLCFFFLSRSYICGEDDLVIGMGRLKRDMRMRMTFKSPKMKHLEKHSILPSNTNGEINVFFLKDKGSLLIYFFYYLACISFKILSVSVSTEVKYVLIYYS